MKSKRNNSPGGILICTSCSDDEELSSSSFTKRRLRFDVVTIGVSKYINIIIKNEYCYIRNYLYLFSLVIWFHVCLTVK